MLPARIGVNMTEMVMHLMLSASGGAEGDLNWWPEIPSATFPPRHDY